MERHIGRLLLVAATLAAPIVAGCTADGSMAPENVAKGFTRSVAAGNLDRARDFLDIPMHVRAYTRTAFQDQLAHLQASIEGCTDISVTISPDQRSAAVRFREGCSVEGVV